MAAPSTFGRAISEARKAKGMSQKELASRILKDDGESITPQYLNDIEHDRRNASSEQMVKQFAKVLGEKPDYLLWLVGKLPADTRRGNIPPEKVQEAFHAFRKALDEGRR